jgi:hypothetical protein
LDPTPSPSRCSRYRGREAPNRIVIIRRMAEPDRVPRLARPFVALLIAAMVASALFVWEPWPLTSFRLFSHLRADEQTAWQATAVERNGDELRYPLGFAIREFVDADDPRRDELCRTWVAAAPEIVAREAVEVRLYRRRWRLSERSGDRALPGRQEHVFTCTSVGSEVAR